MNFLFSVPKPEEVLAEVKILLKDAKYSQADSLLRKAEKKNIYHDDLILAHSNVHALMGNCAEQQNEIKRFIAQKEGNVLHHLKAVEYLITEEHWDLAQKLLDQTKVRFPLSGFTHSTQAQIYCHQGGFEEAAAALLKKQELKKLDDSDIKLVHQIRKGAKNITSLTSDSAITTLLATEQVRQILIRYYFERFESLGGDCEFGFHQRRHGREPLSLFRWGGMPRDSMIKLFQNKFKDFATKESSKLKSNVPTLEEDVGGSMEYYFHDTNYEYMAHTSIGKKSKDFMETEDEVYERLQPHFLMLARKLHEDLEDSEKGFVFKSKPGLSHEECFEFHDALCSIGNTKLIIVLLKQSEKPDYEILRPNLVIARVTRWWGGGASSPKDMLPHREWDNLIEISYNHFLQHYPEMDVA